MQRLPTADFRRKSLFNFGKLIPIAKCIERVTAEEPPDTVRRAPTRNMGKIRLARMLHALAEEFMRIRLRRSGRMAEVRVKAPEQRRAHRRFRVARAETP